MIVNQATIVELELSADTTLRSALAAAPITFNNDVYNNDSRLVSVGSIRKSLDFDNTPVAVTLNLDDADVLAAMNSTSYRYRNATVIKGTPAFLPDRGGPLQLNSANIIVDPALRTRRSSDNRWSISLRRAGTFTSLRIDDLRTLLDGVDALFINGVEYPIFELFDATEPSAPDRVILDFTGSTLPINDLDEVQEFLPAAYSLANTEIVKRGFIDTHSDPSLDGTVEFQISSYSVLAQRGRDDVTAETIHQNRIAEGVYGPDAVSIVDDAFQNTSKDFGHLVLGSTRADSYREQVGGARPCSNADHKFGQDPIFVTHNIAPTEGTRLNNTGEAFHIPVAYGRVKVNFGLLDGFNPTQDQVFAAYGSDWNPGIDLVEQSSKYLTTVVAVAHGEIESCQMYTNHSDDMYQVLTADGPNQQTTYITDSSNRKVAAITFLRGTTDQAGFVPDATDHPSLTWRPNGRGIGVALAMVTLLSFEEWPGGLPQVTFVPNSTRIRSVTANGFSETVSATNRVGDVIADYLTNRAYGLGLPETALNIPSFAAANSANNDVPGDIYPTHLRGSVTGNGSFLTFIQRMLDSCSMRLFENDGQLSLYYGAPVEESEVTAVFNGESELASSNCVINQINPRSREVLNEARGKYFALFDETEKVPDNIQLTTVVTDTGLLASDNNIKSTTDINFDFITTDGNTTDGSVTQADLDIIEGLLTLEIQKSRIASSQIQISTDYNTASAVNVGDVVSVNEPRYGWTGQNSRLFRIVEIEDDNRGSVTLIGQRHTNEIYGAVGDFPNLQRRNSVPVVSDYSTTLANFGAATQGPPGLNTATVDLYLNSATTPTTLPTGNTTYTFADGTLSFTNANGWSPTQVTAPSGQLTYATRALAVANTTTDVISASEWQAPRLVTVFGEDGLSQATVTIFRNATSTPSTTPNGNTTYTFATGAVVFTDANGWTANPVTPPSGQQTYARRANAIGRDETDTITSTEWSAPFLAGSTGSDGQDGLNSVTISLYQRTNLNSAPADPTSALTYTFATQNLTTTGINGWSRRPPADSSDGRFLWIIQASLATRASSASISTGAWSEASLVSIDGSDGPQGDPGDDGDPGAPGNSVFQAKIFQRSGTAPQTPVGGSYDFGLNALTPPSGWSISGDSGSASILWSSTAIFSIAGTTGTDSTVTWTTPQIEARDGDPGSATRGAGRWNVRVGTTVASTYAQSQLNTFLAQAVNGATPIDGDQLWLFASASTADLDVTDATVYIYFAGSWRLQNEVIDGNLLVSDTITTDKIAANAITANEIDVDNLAAISATLGDVNIDAARINSGTINNARIANLDASLITTGTMRADRILLDNATLDTDANGNLVVQTINGGGIISTGSGIGVNVDGTTIINNNGVLSSPDTAPTINTVTWSGGQTARSYNNLTLTSSTTAGGDIIYSNRTFVWRFDLNAIGAAQYQALTGITLENFDANISFVQGSTGGATSGSRFDLEYYTASGTTSGFNTASTFDGRISLQSTASGVTRNGNGTFSTINSQFPAPAGNGRFLFLGWSFVADAAGFNTINFPDRLSLNVTFPSQTDTRMVLHFENGTSITRTFNDSFIQ